jgi:hypothetical protein
MHPLCQPLDCGWFPVSSADPFGLGLLGTRVVARMLYMMVKNCIFRPREVFGECGKRKSFRELQ